MDEVKQRDKHITRKHYLNAPEIHDNYWWKDHISAEIV